MSDTTAAAVFLGAFADHDVECALSVVADDVAVAVYPLGVLGTGKPLIAQVLRDLLTAFPDLIVTSKKVVTIGSAVTAEVKLEGTQAADFAGIVNQEKHIDIDGAWRLQSDGDRLTAIDGYWCQQQVYRRLGVKRFDQVALV